MGSNRGGAILAVAEVVADDTNYRLSDAAAHYADESGILAEGLAGLLTQASEVIFNDPASVAQAAVVWANLSGTLTLTAGLADAAGNFAAADGSLSDPFLALLMSVAIMDVTISDAASVAQAVAVYERIFGELTLAAGLEDSAAHYAAADGALAGGVADLLALDPDASITDAASIAQLTAVDAATAGLLSYPGIADTAANLASFAEGLGWSASAYITEGIEVAVSGPIDADELALIDLLNGDATVNTDPTLLSVPDTYFVETPTSPALSISSHSVAYVVDAPGAQEIRIAPGGKLNLTGSDGQNVIVFEDCALADLVVTHAGATAIFSVAADSTQIASIATDATYAPAQTLRFDDGSVELTNDGTSLALDGVEITVIGMIA